MNNIKSSYVIVANGNFLAREIIQEICQDKIIIALDEAADKLVRIGIIPHVLLGDFDAENENHFRYWGIRKSFTDIKDDDQAYQGNHNVLIIPKKNQNFTDLIKAIRYCDEQHAACIHIICATGGRLDHHEAALRSLRVEYKKNRSLLLHTEQQTLRFAKDECINIEGRVNDHCAILAFPQAIFSSQGLIYDVQHYELNFGYSESIANALRLPQAHLAITGEALIMLPPQFLSQRYFMQKNDLEKTQTLLRDMIAYKKTPTL